MRLTLDVGTQIDAPVSRVWRLLTDTQTWTRWGPSVREVDSTERFIRAGLTGRIRTPFGVWVPFIIDTFEPEHYWDWRVGGVAATGHRVDPRGPDQCRLTFNVPVWAAGYTVVCCVALNRIKRLLALSLQEDRS
ncbi:MAG: SRPBCC family protein [Desulfobacterales bacterium]